MAPRVKEVTWRKDIRGDGGCKLGLSPRSTTLLSVASATSSLRDGQDVLTLTRPFPNRGSIGPRVIGGVRSMVNFDWAGFIQGHSWDSIRMNHSLEYSASGSSIAQSVSHSPRIATATVATSGRSSGFGESMASTTSRKSVASKLHG